MMDWQTLGTALGGILIGVGSFFAGRSGRKVTEASNGAEASVIEMMRQEVERLSRRVAGLESREGTLIRHVYRLEGVMRANGIEPPPFELDGPGGLTGEDEA